jgi:iron only hydrogenase large subunit-like protein
MNRRRLTEPQGPRKTQEDCPWCQKVIGCKEISLIKIQIPTKMKKNQKSLQKKINLLLPIAIIALLANNLISRKPPRDFSLNFSSEFLKKIAIKSI